MTLRLGIMGGAGWLGQAIARAVLAKGFIGPDALAVSYRSKRADLPAAVHQTRDNAELAERCDAIVLSVRPEDWTTAALPLPGKLVISVMAGVPLAALAARLQTRRVVRALPNAAAELGASFTPLFAADGAEPADLALAEQLFACCGTVERVGSEAQLDYLSGLTGTGPAYPALFALAMEQDAIARGLDPALARRAVRSLFVGAGRMLEASAASHAEIVDQFAAYRGVTAAGLQAMRGHGIAAAIRAGLAAADQRAAAMARELAKGPRAAP